MMPPARPKLEYEKVAVDEWLNATIDDVQYNQEYKSVFQGQERVGPAVRLKFSIEGATYPKYSRWLNFNYSAKSNLFKKFITPLVQDAKEYMQFDMDALKGMKIKIMFEQNEEYQNITMVRPIGEKVSANVAPEEPEDATDEMAFP